MSEAQPQISHGMRLVLACARSSLHAADRQSIRHLAPGISDWDAVADLAHAHGVLPLLSRHLRTVAPAAVPPPAAQRLRRLFVTHAAWTFSLATELRDVLERLGAAGIPAVPFKGPAMAVALYGDLLARECSDLDILVR